MKTNDDDGGPAFPIPAGVQSIRLPSGVLFEEAGMTLRDFFAGQAMQGAQSRTDCLTWERLAIEAYGVADAMLAERAKGTEPT